MHLRAGLVSLLLLGNTCAQADLAAEVARGHADWCHRTYARSEELAREMQKTIERFLAAPDAAGLEAARRAWIAARKVYCLTEPLRFCDGPIEPIEPLLNAWPVDEAYLDYVEGRPDCGIVQDPARHPNLTEAVLIVANENGGETNVSVGWHAIEFLLWGQDRSAAGPGARPHTDFIAGQRPHAARRCAYLTAVTALLVRQLAGLRDQWAPDGAYRRKFLVEPRTALRLMLTGVTVMSAFEIGGERLVVAYETRDQENEHSCFSDTTWNDFEANQLGIVAILRGEHGGARHGPGVLALLRERHGAVADDLQRRAEAALARLRAIPQPFDQAMLGADDAPGRRAMLAAIEAVEAQTQSLTIAGKTLGFDLPLRPDD